MLLSASADRTVKIWDVMQGVPVSTMYHSDFVYSASFLSLPTHSASAPARAEHSFLEEVDSADPKPPAVPESDQERLQVVTAARDGVVKIWNVCREGEGQTLPMVGEFCMVLKADLLYAERKNSDNCLLVILFEARMELQRDDYVTIYLPGFEVSAGESEEEEAASLEFKSMVNKDGWCMDSDSDEWYCETSFQSASTRCTIPLQIRTESAPAGLFLYVRTLQRVSATQPFAIVVPE
eukprot:750173-Hanusia_phi.AAC.1